MHDHLDARVCLAGTFDLFDGETLVHGAEALPQNHLGAGVIGRIGGAALCLERIPQRHLAQRNAHRAGGIAAQMLVREEQHALAAANAHSSTACALEEVHTMPPLRPQNAFSAADEFM